MLGEKSSADFVDFRILVSHFYELHLVLKKGQGLYIFIFFLAVLLISYKWIGNAQSYIDALQ